MNRWQQRTDGEVEVVFEAFEPDGQHFDFGRADAGARLGGATPVRRFGFGGGGGGGGGGVVALAHRLALRAGPVERRRRR